MGNQIKSGKMNCGGRCLKILLYILNIFFFVGGLITAICAGYAALDKNSRIQELLQDYKTPFFFDGMYILLAVGILLLFFSLIGLWGTFQENTCLLFIYVLALFIVLVLQIAGVIVCFVELKKIETATIAKLAEAPNSNATSTFVQEIGAFEYRFHCCGVTGPQDYGENDLPPSCYNNAKTESERFKRGISSLTGNISSSNNSYTQTVQTAGTVLSASTQTQSTVFSNGSPYKIGCIQVAQPYLHAAGGIAIALILLELLALICTCTFMSAIRDQYEAV